MLVVISDMHMTDGTAAATLHPGAMHLFIQHLRDTAERASWRAGGRYVPIERLDLVLLGDTLDIINSRRWLDAGIRPWNAIGSPELVQTTADIVDEILRHNQPSMQLMRSLASDEIITVPPANQHGQPVPMAEGVPVAVRTHYVVGNRDWMLRLKGSQYDLIRQRIAHHLGLANPHNQPFPHDAIESDELIEMLRKHRVFARHGDIFDPLSFSGDRDVASISDAIVIEVIGGFLQNVQRLLSEQLSVSVMQQLSEVQHMRPLVLAPVYIDGLLARVCTNPAQRKQIQRVWDTQVDRLLALPLVREQDTVNALDLVDGLDRCLSFRRRLAIGWAEQSRRWVQEMRGAIGPSFVQHAMAEQDFRNRRARHIVYGHTHTTEQMPLDASHADGFVLNQMYFNSGTWRRVFQPTQIPGSEQEFIATESMTLLSFFHGDERSGRSFETISGTLGLTTNSIPNLVSDRIVGAERPIASQRRMPSEAAMANAIRTSPFAAAETALY